MKAKEARERGFYSAGEVSEMLGVTSRTLRYYESEGLIQPVRTDGGTRYYSQFQIRRAEVCVQVARLGFPIKVLQQLAHLRESAETGDDAAHRLDQLLSEIRARVGLQINGLKYLHSEIGATQRLLGQCAGCPNEPSRAGCPDCVCERKVDSTFLLALIWDPDRGEDGDG